MFGRMDENIFGPRGHGFSNLFASKFPPFFFLGLDKDRIGSRQSYHLRVAQPIRLRDNNLVASLTGSEYRVVTGMFGAATDDDLGRVVGELIVLMKLVRDCLAKLGDS